jgi:FKBP-type peptidyl-prolyl cis-trans isomerase (trigger factor)
MKSQQVDQKLIAQVLQSIQEDFEKQTQYTDHDVLSCTIAYPEEQKPDFGTAMCTLRAHIVDQVIQAVYKPLVKKYAIPGFRHGKAPMRTFIMKFGYAHFMEHVKYVLFGFIQRRLALFTTEHIELFHQFNPLLCKQGEDFTAEIEFIKRPVVTLVDWIAPPQQVDITQATPEFIQQYITRLRLGASPFDPANDVAIQTYDKVKVIPMNIVDVDQPNSQEDVPPDEAVVSDPMQFIIDGIETPPEISDILRGMRCGESKRFSLTSQMFVPKPVRLTFLVQEITRPTLISVEQYIEQEHSDDEKIKTSAQLEQWVTEKYNQQQRNTFFSSVREKISRTVLENAQVTIPEPLILEYRKNVFEKKMLFDPDYTARFDEEEEMYRDLFAQAQFEYRQKIVLEEVLRTYDASLSSKDLLYFVKMMPQRFFETERNYFSTLSKKLFDQFRIECAIQKAMDLLLIVSMKEQLLPDDPVFWTDLRTKLPELPEKLLQHTKEEDFTDVALQDESDDPASHNVFHA